MSLNPDPDAVLITVADDGPGISPGLPPDVFERFARGDSSRSRREGSTGLGLAIVAAVVKAHGGTIKVDSSRGSTEFVVCPPGSSSQGTHRTDQSGTPAAAASMGWVTLDSACRGFPAEQTRASSRTGDAELLRLPAPSCPGSAVGQHRGVLPLELVQQWVGECVLLGRGAGWVAELDRDVVRPGRCGQRHHRRQDTRGVVDRPDISVRLFGLNSWSVPVPQALMGVGAVVVLYGCGAPCRRTARPACSPVRCWR